MLSSRLAAVNDLFLDGSQCALLRCAAFGSSHDTRDLCRSRPSFLLLCIARRGLQLLLLKLLLVLLVLLLLPPCKKS